MFVRCIEMFLEHILNGKSRAIYSTLKKSSCSDPFVVLPANSESRDRLQKRHLQGFPGFTALLELLIDLICDFALSARLLLAKPSCPHSEGVGGYLNLRPEVTDI